MVKSKENRINVVRRKLAVQCSTRDGGNTVKTLVVRIPTEDFEGTAISEQTKGNLERLLSDYDAIKTTHIQP